MTGPPNEPVPAADPKTEDTKGTEGPEEEVKRPRAARLARKFALPIVLFWVLAAIVTNVFVPSIEENTKANAKALTPGTRRRRRPRSSKAARSVNPTTPVLSSFFSKPRAASSATRTISITTSWYAAYVATNSTCSHCWTCGASR